MEKKKLMEKIIIGPAGFGGDSIKGLHRIHEAGMRCAEVEFTHGIVMKNPKAKQVGLLAKQLNVDLSIHAPYFINLATQVQKL